MEWELKYKYDYQLHQLHNKPYHKDFVDYQEYLFDMVQKTLATEPFTEEDRKAVEFQINMLRLGVIGVLKKGLHREQKQI